MKEILEQAKLLNNNLPEVALKRNSVHYELVSYINHSITFLICEKYDEVALFIMRAYKFIEKKQMPNDLYIKLCKDYLNNLIKYLKTNELLSKKGIFYIENLQITW